MLSKMFFNDVLIIRQSHHAMRGTIVHGWDCIVLYNVLYYHVMIRKKQMIENQDKIRISGEFYE